MSLWFKRILKLREIKNLVDDWLTPVDYLPYIDALLGDIDLDPCSTHLANNQFLRAKQIYTIEDDGINIEIPWKGTTYLFPPTYGRCSFSEQRGTWKWSSRAQGRSKIPSVTWFNRLEKEWKLRNVSEALFFSTNPEMMRVCPNMWKYPVCIPTKRANLVHGKDLFMLDTPFTWGFFVYLPRLDLGFNQADNFVEIFSNIGNIIY